MTSEIDQTPKSTFQVSKYLISGNQIFRVRELFSILFYSIFQGINDKSAIKRKMMEVAGSSETLKA